MKNLNTPLILTKDDYKLLTSYLKGAWGKTAFDQQNAEDLKAELKKAKIVDKNKLPLDVVRLNSRVTIKAEDKSQIMELILVTPDKANIKENKISILAPIGTALLGFRLGDKIKWQVPAGSRTFTILEVSNPS
jgi:regulator of nucleoside diphosphate kinase